MLLSKQRRYILVFGYTRLNSNDIVPDDIKSLLSQWISHRFWIVIQGDEMQEFLNKSSESAMTRTWIIPIPSLKSASLELELFPNGYECDEQASFVVKPVFKNESEYSKNLFQTERLQLASSEFET